MKKGLYIAIISIITVGCIVGGTAYHTYNAGKKFVSFVAEGFGKEVDFEESANVLSNNLSIEKFNSIDIDAHVLSTKIKVGDKFSVEYDCTEELKPIIEVQNGVLTIRQNDVKKFHFGNNRADMVITVPEKMTLSSLKVEQDVGEFSMKDVNAEDCDIENNVGNIVIKNGNIGKAVLSTDTGNIEIKNCEFTSLEGKSNVGNVEVSTGQSVVDYKIDMSTDVGNVEVNGKRYKGGYHQNGSDKNHIDLQSDVGDVELEYE